MQADPRASDAHHLEGEIDARSRMIFAVVRVKNPYKTKNNSPLTVGLFVNAEIMGKTVGNLVAVPRAALRNNDQILIVDEGDRLRFRKVSIYRSGAHFVYINEGIHEGEIICLSQPKTVMDGMQVTPIYE